MIKKHFLVLLFGISAFSLAAADSADRLHFPVTGFSIAPLESPPGQVSQQAAIMMFLPSVAGFAANVNVLVQPYKDSLEDYEKTTLGQIKEAEYTLIDQKKFGKTAVVFEYSGEMNGKSLHFYARAEKSGDHIYLVTATGADAKWSKQGSQLKTCVDSFRCEGR